MYLEELSDKVWATKNARFLASKRMARSRKSSTVAVALLSASIIAVNMLVFFGKFKNEDISTMITVITVILSTFSLVMSLLIAMLRYEYREDNYHQCGLELENLNQRIRLKIRELTQNGGIDKRESSMEDNERFKKEYFDIQMKYNLNHTTFDYVYSKWKSGINDSNNANSDKQKTKCEKIFLSIWYWVRYSVFDVYFLYWLIAIVPVAILVYVFCDIATGCSPCECFCVTR